MFSLLLFCAVWDYFKTKVKPDRQYEQKFSPKSYKTETKILASSRYRALSNPAQIATLVNAVNK